MEVWLKCSIHTLWSRHGAFFIMKVAVIFCKDLQLLHVSELTISGNKFISVHDHMDIEH